MGNNKYKILIIEDDRKISGFVESALQTSGYQVLIAENCSQGILLFESHLPDLVLLDLGLPDEDGEQFIRHARQDSATPIIVLSARTEEMDKVSALDLGANDYITKPFYTGELLARIRAAMRSSRQGMATGNVFTSGGLRIDYDARQVTMEGRPIHLTQTEYNIMALLSQNAGKMMTYAMIIQHIWGKNDSGSVKKLQVNMANIRKKLGLSPGTGGCITNELGVGYRMVEE